MAYVREKTSRFSATQRLTPNPLGVYSRAFILNGSSYISFFAPTEWLGLSPGEGLGVMLLWTLFLISSVLLIARGLIRGVNSLE